ncbi:MAG: Flp family type IVb pilin [Nitrospirales bacterium]
MVNQIVRFMQEEEGATAIEYGLLAALIAAIIVGTVGTLGQTVNQAFTDVNAGMQ